MAGVGMKFDKRFFFDRKAVADIVGKKAAKNLSKAGAFVRTKARQSMRRRKKASSPGSPPSAHSKDATASLKNIQFAFDPSRLSLVVGPMLLNGSQGAPVPGMNEHGGSRNTTQWRWKPLVFFRRNQDILKSGRIGTENDWRIVSKKRAKIIKRSARGAPLFEFREAAVHYPKRPFMGPALIAEAPKFPSLFGRSA